MDREDAGGAADFLRGVSRDATGGEAADEVEIEVLEENWDAVQVFLRCCQQYVGTLAGVRACGFTAQEVEAGCRLAEIAAEQRPEVSLQVMEMGLVAAKQINSRTVE
ncbi:DUF1799 domain-containing protein [Vulcaniibacterium tengchongense]|uniref:DUF1799 domain-containing protein n=1 Tax=Vulcaniibacterium tengchongense TaxID=1273429 RepID=UPI001315AB96|nr:DUF1799 domain-containing protein [Vulcaniibacterium tengchongense]